jgi:hypothetical protein
MAIQHFLPFATLALVMSHRDAQPGAAWSFAGGAGDTMDQKMASATCHSLLSTCCPV